VLELIVVPCFEVYSAHPVIKHRGIQKIFISRYMYHVSLVVQMFIQAEGFIN
jgi:hypothetical protein